MSSFFYIFVITDYSDYSRLFSIKNITFYQKLEFLDHIYFFFIPPTTVANKTIYSEKLQWNTVILSDFIERTLLILEYKFKFPIATTIYVDNVNFLVKTFRCSNGPSEMWA